MSVSHIFMVTICTYNVKNDTINIMSENNIGGNNLTYQVLFPSIIETSGIMFIIKSFPYSWNWQKQNPKNDLPNERFVRQDDWVQVLRMKNIT